MGIRIIKKIKFYEKSIDKHYLKYYNKSCRKTNASYIINADVAELADAQDLKSCGWINRAGSIPAICTKVIPRVWEILEVLFFLPKIQKFYKNFFTIIFVELFSYYFNKLLTTSPVTTLADLPRWVYIFAVVL